MNSEKAEAQSENGFNGSVGRKRFFLNHKRSSALVVTIALHAVFVAAAIGFVVVQAMKPEPAVFAGTEVPRPQPKLKKIEIPVKDSKKNKAPKLRQMITTKPNVAVNLQMPEMVGINGGSGYGKGTGLGGMGLGFDFNIFGDNRGSGNEFVGTLYDLKMDEDGKPTGMTVEEYFKEVGRFCSSWNPRRLDDYFRAPKNKYARAFFFPEIEAVEAPKAFGVEGIVKPELWIIHYIGKMKAPESGQYRFVGYGDDVLIVRVGRKNVLQGNWNDRKAIDWESDDDADQRYKIFGQRPLFVGDWFQLEKGREVEVNVLFGECSGGKFAGALLIEKKGVDYPRSVSGGPLLPLFKTAEVPQELRDNMRVNSREASIEGPLFGILNDTSE